MLVHIIRSCACTVLTQYNPMDTSGGEEGKYSTKLKHKSLSTKIFGVCMTFYIVNLFCRC